MSLDVTFVRGKTVVYRAEAFIDKNIVDFAIREILDPAKRLAASRRLAQSYIDHLKIEKTGWMKIQIVQDLEGPKGIPLGVMLEKGWGHGGYFIFPKNFPDGRLYFYWEKVGHYVSLPFALHPGFDGYHLFDNIIWWGFIERFKEKLIQATNEYMMRTRFK